MSRFYVDLVPQKPRREEGDRYIREQRSKENTGAFYVGIHQALFGGEMSPRYRGRHTELLSGQMINGDPDIRRQHSYGNDVVEVKSASWVDRRPSFTLEQLRNHSFRFLQELISEGAKMPDYQTAIYLFHHSSRGYPFLWGASASDAIRAMSRETHVGLVLPSNLTYALALSMKSTELDKTASKSQTAGVFRHRPPQKIIYALSESRAPVGQLEDYLRNEGPKLEKEVVSRFRLGDLKVKDISSEEFSPNLRVEVAEHGKEHSFKVKPFRVRQFVMPKKANLEWLADFKQNHQFFLEEILGVRDLFYEEHEGGDAAEPPSLEGQGKELNLEDNPFL